MVSLSSKDITKILMIHQVLPFQSTEASGIWDGFLSGLCPKSLGFVSEVSGPHVFQNIF